MTRHITSRLKTEPSHYNARVQVTSSAPTRIDLAGGTLDIWPLYLYHDDAQTLNAAITLRAHCTVSGRQDGQLCLRSLDTDRSLEVTHWSELKDTPDFRLVGRILRFFQATSLNLITRSDSPIGAGIAGSSALNIALCAAMARWQGASYSTDELLTIAMNVEAQAIRVPTGIQDYRSAVYGGISAIEMGTMGVRRIALDVDPVELERRIVLAYTGASRHSGVNNWEVIKGHIDGDRSIFDHFERIRDVAAAMREALVRGDWDDVGHQIAAEWDSRKRLAPQVTTPEIEGLIEQARRAGSTAAKVCGAGGGGCVLCFADPSAVPAVRQALENAGARVLECRIDTAGVRVEVTNQIGA